jgi:hypothetical protein
MRYSSALPVLFVLFFSSAPTAHAEDVTLSTEHSSPRGLYTTVNANDQLDIGTAAIAGDADLFGSLSVEKVSAGVPGCGRQADYRRRLKNRGCRWSAVARRRIRQ